MLIEMWSYGQSRVPVPGEPRYEKECVYYADDNCLTLVRFVHGQIVATFVPARWQPVEQSTSSKPQVNNQKGETNEAV